MIDVQNIQKVYSDGEQTIRVFESLSFKLNAGDTVALMGQSGAGKSTLLHLLGGFDFPDSGEIKIAGSELTKMNDQALSSFRRKYLGMVFQQYNLIESLTAKDNISFVRRLNGLPAMDDYTGKLISSLNLDSRLSHYPGQLSGGEQQRVAIARALATGPALLLADEPTGNLDEKTAAQVMEQLTEVVEYAKTTLLLVTHSSVTAGYLKQTWHLEQGKLSPC